MSPMTESFQRDIRQKFVASAVLALEEIPLDLRHAALLVMVEGFAKGLIAKYDGMTVADFSAIFVKDHGLGPIGDEITAALTRLEAGAGAVDREALAALAKGARPTDRNP
jgi:hypothetical protein